MIFNIVYLLNHQSKLAKLQKTINQKYRPKLNNIKENLKDGLGLQEVEQWKHINVIQKAIRTVDSSKVTIGRELSEEETENLAPYIRTRIQDARAQMVYEYGSKITLDLDEYPIANQKYNPLLSYDPRVTYWVYLNELLGQLEELVGFGGVSGVSGASGANDGANRGASPAEALPSADPQKPNIIKSNTVVPFSWNDWVDLTFLNNELLKPIGNRKTCEFLSRTHHVPGISNYCTNVQDLTMKDLAEMQIADIDYFPGFVIRHSPDNKALNEVRMLEGKDYLLSYAPPPFKIIWMLQGKGIEVDVEGKQRMVDRLLPEVVGGRNGTIEIDPIEVFRLVGTLIGLDSVTGQPDPKIPVQKSMDVLDFQYGQNAIDNQIHEFEARLDALFTLSTNELLYNQTAFEMLKLTRNEYLYYQGLRYANSFRNKKEPTYFHMARLNFDVKDKRHDPGWHYDWRFFNGGMKHVKDDWTYEQMKVRNKILLERLLRNWFKFSQTVDAVSWLAHGPLLAWYWDGLLFPFDDDIDVQMPIKYLVDFCRDYNQSLVVEDINEGFGKYFVDCSSFIHHRYRTKSNNHIDARFIDVDTGSYIDITALSVSDDLPPKKYQPLIQEAELNGLFKPVYNCRHSHFVSHEELSPLRRTKLNGVPVYVPNKIQQILQDEYTEGLESYEYEGWYFIDALQLWLHGTNISQVFDFEEFDADDPAMKTKMLAFVGQLQKDANLLLQLDNVAQEYYLTRHLTQWHSQEMSYMFNTTGTKSGWQQFESPMNQWKVFADDIHFEKPLSMPLFMYEYLERTKNPIA